MSYNGKPVKRKVASERRQVQIWGNQVRLMGQNRSWPSVLTLIFCISSRYCLCVSKCTLVSELCTHFFWTTQALRGNNVARTDFLTFLLCLECANRGKKDKNINKTTALMVVNQNTHILAHELVEVSFSHAGEEEETEWRTNLYCSC